MRIVFVIFLLLSSVNNLVASVPEDLVLEGIRVDKASGLVFTSDNVPIAQLNDVVINEEIGCVFNQNNDYMCSIKSWKKLVKSCLDAAPRVDDDIILDEFGTPIASTLMSEKADLVEPKDVFEPKPFDEIYFTDSSDNPLIRAVDLVDPNKASLFAFDGSELSHSNALYPAYKPGFPNVMVYHPYHFDINPLHIYFPAVIRKANSFLTFQNRMISIDNLPNAFRPHYCVPNGNYAIHYKFWHFGDVITGSVTGEVVAHDQIASPDNLHLPALNYGGVGSHVVTKAVINGHTYFTVLCEDMPVMMDRMQNYLFATSFAKENFSLQDIVAFLDSLEDSIDTVSGKSDLISELNAAFGESL